MRPLAIASLLGLLLFPATAAAQAGASISGLVEDTTGGILPGVTVEATSPVMIEGVIAAFTDSAGRYTIINLRPGTYTLTFTLPGFSTVIREDVLLVGDGARCRWAAWSRMPFRRRGQHLLRHRVHLLWHGSLSGRQPHARALGADLGHQPAAV